MGNHLRKIQAFVVHIEIAFSNFVPSLNLNLSVEFNFTAFIVIFIFRALSTFRYLDVKYKLQSLFSVQSEFALNIRVKFLVLFTIVCICI